MSTAEMRGMISSDVLVIFSPMRQFWDLQKSIERLYFPSLTYAKVRSDEPQPDLPNLVTAK